MFSAFALIGTVLNAGTPCPEVRADDGRLIKVIGLPNTIESGDHVRIIGKMRFSMSCQAEVLAAQIVEKTKP
jgi:hypothetical protein